MELVKYLILFFIFGTTSFMGILLGKKYSNRVKELQEMKNALSIFEARIEYTYEPIPEIFTEISRKADSNIAEIFRKTVEKMRKNTAENSWIEAIEYSNTNLNKEDKEILKSLGKMLGKTDIKGQINQIELTSNFLDTQIDNARMEKEKNGKMYKTLRSGIRTCYCYCTCLGKRG